MCILAPAVMALSFTTTEACRIASRQPTVIRLMYSSKSSSDPDLSGRRTGVLATKFLDARLHEEREVLQRHPWTVQSENIWSLQNHCETQHRRTFFVLVLLIGIWNSCSSAALEDVHALPRVRDVHQGRGRPQTLSCPHGRTTDAYSGQ